MNGSKNITFSATEFNEAW